jgi:hypothetical protein
MKDSLGEVISMDRKSLRGSRRELPALGVVVAAGQEIRVALAKRRSRERTRLKPP